MHLLLKVFHQIGDFNKWKNWFPAFMDKGVTVTILHGQNDSSESAELNDNYGRKIIFRMLRPLKNVVDVDLYTKEKNTTNYQFILMPDSSGNTEIIWNVTTDLGWYPWKKLQGIVLDKVSGPEYISALQNLKKVTETAPAQVK